MASPRLEHEITGCCHRSGIVAKKGDDGWPFRYHRLPFVTFPTVVNLSQSAELARYILLTQIQRQPSIAEMLSKSLGLGNDSFLSEDEGFKCFLTHLDRKKAKWQNRVIPTSQLSKL